VLAFLWGKVRGAKKANPEETCMPDTKPTRAIKSWLKKLETALTGKDTDKAVKLLRQGQLLARPRLAHLEHQDSRRP
jgi:hypothetical protein